MPHSTSNCRRFSGHARATRSALSVLALALMVSGLGGTSEATFAQGLFESVDRPPARPRKAKRRAPSAAAAESAAEKPSAKKKRGKGETAVERAIRGPLVINVSLSRQRLTVYDANGPIAESPVSSGRVGYSTPTGVFSVVQKRRQHYSNLYAGASMPNMQRITWSGVALHAGPLPGYPASHGCIRLPHGFSKKLFSLTSMGTRVIVSREPVMPKPIVHDRLFAAFPPEEVAQPDAAVKVADASGTAAVSSVLGVAAAHAAETPAPATAASPRSAYRERRRIEAEQLAAEIREAGDAKAARESQLDQAQKDAAAAYAPYNAARAEAERLAAELQDLEQAKVRVDREIADLEKPDETERRNKRKARKALDGPAREARLTELRDELMEYPAQHEAARAAFATADAARAAAEAVAKEADAKRRAAMAELGEANIRLTRALAKEQAARRMEEKRKLPVSIFISRAKKRLYVRQGYEDMFDVEIALADPETPIGTHVFTALDYTPEKTAMQWSVASIPYDPSRAARRKKADRKGKADVQVASVDLSRQTAAAALERITVPDEVREQIADVMKPGSSLVISDLPIGNETGAYTDFIVPIR